jgi:hypothetical protein
MTLKFWRAKTSTFPMEVRNHEKDITNHNHYWPDHYSGIQNTWDTVSFCRCIFPGENAHQEAPQIDKTREA